MMMNMVTTRMTRLMMNMMTTRMTKLTMKMVRWAVSSIQIRLAMSDERAGSAGQLTCQDSRRLASPSRVLIPQFFGSHCTNVRPEN